MVRLLHRLPRTTLQSNQRYLTRRCLLQDQCCLGRLLSPLGLPLVQGSVLRCMLHFLPKWAGSARWIARILLYHDDRGAPAQRPIASPTNPAPLLHPLPVVVKLRYSRGQAPHTTTTTTTSSAAVNPTQAVLPLI